MANLKHIVGVAQSLLMLLDPNPDRPGLRETPERVAKAWAHWTSGYRMTARAVLKTFEDGAEGCDEMVFQGKIPFYSHCEHHLAPFFGLAHIAYIPDGHIVGLSKLSRVVDVYARRLQVQERLTNEIATSLMRELKPKGCGVVLQARHLCMESRGIARTGTVTVTSAVHGVFKDAPEVRAEFMGFVGSAMQGITTL